MFFKDLKVILACLAVWIALMMTGMITSYPSPAFPDINSGHYGFKLSVEVMSWLASFPGLFGVIGAAIAAPVIDRYGRKFTFVAVTIPMAVGWLLTLASVNVAMFVVGRALLGTASGWCFATTYIYTSEVSPKKIRGLLCLFNGTSYGIGCLAVDLLGAFINWRWIAVVCLATVTAMSLSTFFMYETPRWLVSKGYREAAMEFMEKVWNMDDPEQIKREMDEIDANVKLTTSVTYYEGLVQLVKPPLWRPLVITQLMMVFQQFSGIAYINTYTAQIFQEASANIQLNDVLFQSSSYDSSFVFAAFTLACLISSLFVDRFGRRLLIIWSMVVNAISLTAVGAYYFVKQTDQWFASRYLFWLPLVGLLLYIMSYGGAFASIPFLLLSELFPLQVRAMANSVGNINRSICFFIVAKAFTSQSSLPAYVIFWSFASVVIVGIIFVMFCIPETKGRSLEDIQQQWYSSKIRRQHGRDSS